LVDFAALVIQQFRELSTESSNAILARLISRDFFHWWSFMVYLDNNFFIESLALVKVSWLLVVVSQLS
jgi:hypothetical protein